MRNRANTFAGVAIAISGVTVANLSIMVTALHGPFLLAMLCAVGGVFIGAYGGYSIGQAKDIQEHQSK